MYRCLYPCKIIIHCLKKKNPKPTCLESSLVEKAVSRERNPLSDILFLITWFPKGSRQQSVYDMTNCSSKKMSFFFWLVTSTVLWSLVIGSHRRQPQLSGNIGKGKGNCLTLSCQRFNINTNTHFHHSQYWQDKYGIYIFFLTLITVALRKQNCVVIKI